MTASLLAVLALLLWPTPGVAVPLVAVGRRRVVTERGSDRSGHLRIPASGVTRPRRADDPGWVADLADVVVVGLDAGLDLPRAVLAAARSPTVARCAPWLEPRLTRGLARGRPVTACLGARDVGEPVSGDRAPSEELEVLVRAWRLSEEVGAAASATTAAAASCLRARRLDRQRAAALSAGPRASMWLLSCLPLVGPVAGLLTGVGPGRLYASTPALASAGVGLLLTVLGWWWAHSVIDRAGRPATTRGRP